MTCGTRLGNVGQQISLTLAYGASYGPVPCVTDFDIPDDSLSGALVSSDGTETAIVVTKTAAREFEIEIPVETVQAAQPEGGWYVAIDWGGGKIDHMVGGPYRVRREGELP